MASFAVGALVFLGCSGAGRQSDTIPIGTFGGGGRDMAVFLYTTRNTKSVEFRYASPWPPYMRDAKYELVKSHSFYTLTNGGKRCGKASLGYVNGLLVLRYANRTIRMTFLSDQLRQAVVSSVKSAASYYRTLKWRGGGTIDFELPSCR